MEMAPRTVEVKIGEFLAGQVGGRVDGRAGFADADAENAAQASIAEEGGHEGRRFARGGAIADGDGLHVVARHERGQGFARAGFVVARLEGVDDRVFQKFAGIVNHGDLAAGADSGVERQHGHAAGGRGEQEILEVLAEDFDSLFVGTVLEFQADFGLDGGIEKTIVGVRDGALEVRGPNAWHALDLRGQPGERAGGREFDLEVQHPFVGAAANGEHPVGRDPGGRLAVLGIQLEFAFGVRGTRNGAAGDAAIGHHHGADPLAEACVLVDHFGDDVARAFESLLGRDSEAGGNLGERVGPDCSQRYRASGSSPFSRAMQALVRRLGL